MVSWFIVVHCGIRVDHSRPSYLALSSLSGSNVKLSFVASRAHGLLCKIFVASRQDGIDQIGLDTPTL